jgi:mono/diheme cytochrome c family protein
MRRGVLIGGVAVLLAAFGSVRAQDAESLGLTPKQALGRQLFGQDCGVCHTAPTITSSLYGPALSKGVVDGNEAAIRQFIARGSQRMPGFRYYYSPDQIDDVVEYLKTVGAPTGPAAPVKNNP